MGLAACLPTKAAALHSSHLSESLLPDSECRRQQHTSCPDAAFRALSEYLLAGSRPVSLLKEQPASHLLDLGCTTSGPYQLHLAGWRAVRELEGLRGAMEQRRRAHAFAMTTHPRLGAGQHPLLRDMPLEVVDMIGRQAFRSRTPPL